MTRTIHRTQAEQKHVIEEIRMGVYFTRSLGASFQVELPLVQLAQIYRDLSEGEKMKKGDYGKWTF